LSGARRVSGKFEERVAPLGPFQATPFGAAATLRS
jgi:hypothetical protein